MKPSLRLEKKLWAQGYDYLAGVDEAGRGAWAGPIVAGAVVLSRAEFEALKKEWWFKAVADSKSLSPLQRQRVFAACAAKVVWATAVVSHKVIDQLGIGAANRRVVNLAVAKLKHKPQMVLADYVAKLGNSLAGVPARVIVKADATLWLVALASIVAKVQRDRLMVEYDKKYPGYGLARHKGYGTKQHQTALNQLGVCALHRRSYRPVRAHLL
jgi:ribonuclease HII